MDTLSKLILLSLCSVLGTLALEDGLFDCSEWYKQCVDEGSAPGPASLKIVSGQYFNCYVGFSPKCFKEVPEETKSPEEFCKEMESRSEYDEKEKTCIVEAQPVDDDADHFTLFANFYS